MKIRSGNIHDLYVSIAEGLIKNSVGVHSFKRLDKTINTVFTVEQSV